MLNIFSKYIWGGLEDQVGLFFRSWWLNNYNRLGATADVTNYYGYPDITSIQNPVFSNQPLFAISFDYLIQYINPVIFVNVYLLIQIILTVFFAYKFFGNFINSKVLKIALSGIFILSPFFYYHVGVHPALTSVWPLLAFMHYYFNLRLSLKNNLILGLLLSASFLFNNYFGYFGLLFLGSNFLSEVVINLKGIKKDLVLSLIKKYFVIIFTFFITSIIFLTPYLFFKPLTTIEVPYSRSFEDFFYFTSRPWYYFLPSVDNPFMGEYSAKAIEFLQDEWRYWLTSNYFRSEHSSSYLGFFNFIFAICGVVYSFKTKNKTNISLFLTALFLIIITMPPYFTLSMIKIYMPSYFLMDIFPMFRSLVRLGVLILLIELVFAGLGLNYLLKYFSKETLRLKSTNLNSYIFVLCSFVFFCLSVIDFYIPLKISQIGNPPLMYSYIKENIEDNSSIAVYPYNSSLGAVFWISEHNKPVVNPRDYISNEFHSENFTQDLQTDEGLIKAKERGADYLVFFRYAGGKDHKKEWEFFESSPRLKKVKEIINDDLFIKENKDRFIRLEDLSTIEDSYGVIYQIL